MRVKPTKVKEHQDLPTTPEAGKCVAAFTAGVLLKHLCVSSHRGLLSYVHRRERLGFRGRRCFFILDPEMDKRIVVALVLPVRKHL